MAEDELCRERIRVLIDRYGIIFRGILERELPPFLITKEAINCHHNYVSMENHFGANVHVTRKGAVRARVGDYGIIPGSMGARSYIVRGLGNPD